MKSKLFGTQTGLSASDLILGTAMFGNRSGYGADKDTATEIFNAYKEAGGNFIDTSDAYQLGESEEIIGELISKNRQDFIICSKYTRTHHRSPSIVSKGNHRKAITEAVENSLRRLKTDYIDFYMPHYDDLQTPFEEVIRGMEDLVKSGKIIYPGLANFPAWKAAAIAAWTNALHLTPLAAIQIEYNLLQRTADRELWFMAKNFGLGVMLYSPLAGGLLTGKYRSDEKGRLTLRTNTSPEEDAVSSVVNDYLAFVAKEMNITPAAIAMAWNGTKDGFTIIGPRTLKQLNDYLQATTLTLSKTQIDHLNKISAIDLGYPYEMLLKN
jgi:aryl-alcohol dehydrogenase-like predicted oxidoreductase